MKSNAIDTSKTAGKVTDILARAGVGVLLLPALVCLVIAALVMRPGTFPAEAVEGLWLVLAGVLLYGGALFVRARLPVTLPSLPPVLRRSAIRMTAEPVPLRPLLLGLGVGLLLVLAEVNGQAFTDWKLASHGQAALLVAGCVLIVVGFAGKAKGEKRNAESARTSSQGQERSAGKYFFGVLFSPLGLLTIFAFLLYLWRVDQTLHIWIDEFHFAEQIVRLWRDPARPLLPPNPGIAAFTSVYAYLQLLAVGVFGADLFALRFVSAVFGALIVRATYFLAREWLSVSGEKEEKLNAKPQRGKGAEEKDKKHNTESARSRRWLDAVALFAAVFIAVFPPHVHFSRIGLNNIADPLFGVLALAFFTRGLRTGGALHYALAGVMLGLTQYFYEGGKLLYPPLFAAYLLLALIVWRPFGQWRGVLVTLFCAGIVALPIYYTAWATAGTLTPRLDEKARGLPEAILSDLREGRFDEVWELNLRPPILHFTTLPDSSTFFYGGETGILLSYLQPLFWLGIAVAVWRLRVIGAVLVLWLLATIGGNMLIGDNTYTARYVVALPALALLVTVGAREIWAFIFGASETPDTETQSDNASLATHPRRLTTRLGLNVFAVVMSAALLVPNVLYYFGPHLDAANQQIRKFYDHIDVLYRARELPPGTQVYIIARDPNFGLTNSIWGIHYGILSTFWNYHPVVEIWLAGDPLTYEAIAALADGLPRVFFIEADDTATLAALQARYPALAADAGQFSPYESVPRDKQYVMYFVEAR